MTKERGKALITDKIARRDLLTPMVLMTRRITRFRVFTPITLDNSLLIFVCIREKYLCIDSFARYNSHNYPVQDVFQSARAEESRSTCIAVPFLHP